MVVRIVRRAIYRINDPHRTRKIELAFDNDLFAQKLMLRKLRSQMFADDFVRTKVCRRDDLCALLLMNLIRSLTRQLNDDFTRSLGSGNSFVESQLEFGFTLHRKRGAFGVRKLGSAMVRFSAKAGRTSRTPNAPRHNLDSFS